MFEFPDNSYGTVYTTLCAPASSTIRENNIYNVDLLRVGLWKVAETRNAEVLAFLESENMPYEIIYYETAEEQLEAFNNGSVDVISSVSLSPVANSRIVAQFAPRPYYFASIKAIRTSKHPEALTIPIVAMTANAFVKDVQDALDAGMNAHIAKPINMEMLKNTLASCIILNTNKIKEKICAEILYIRDCRLDFFQILNGV